MSAIQTPLTSTQLLQGIEAGIREHAFRAGIGFFYDKEDGFWFGKVPFHDIPDRSLDVLLAAKKPATLAEALQKRLGTTSQSPEELLVAMETCVRKKGELLMAWCEYANCPQGFAVGISKFGGLRSETVFGEDRMPTLQAAVVELMKSVEVEEPAGLKG